MKCALVSLNQLWQDKAANLKRCEMFVAQAKLVGCELVVFPEMTLTGYSLDIGKLVELAASSNTLVHFGEMAEHYGINIVFGACLTQPAWSKPRNVFCLASPDGSATVLYEKVHPFSFAGENTVLGAGERLGLNEVGGMRFGAAICYDLRFPELYSAMATLCDFTITIANWPARRIAHWRTLLQARAIENQCYTIGVNRTGCDGNGQEYVKSSMIVTPEGEIAKPMVTDMEIDIYEIDAGIVARYRELFPTVRDKRYSLYSSLLEKRVC